MVERPKNRIILAFIAAASLLLTGCNNNTLNILKVTGESSDTITVLDKNGILYDIDKDTQTYSAPYKKQTISLLVPIDDYTADYTLVHNELVKYTGSLNDAIGYFKLLCSKGYLIETYAYTAESFDAVVCSDEERIRILYIGGDTVRIFYENKNNSDYFPPYISEKEKN